MSAKNSILIGFILLASVAKAQNLKKLIDKNDGAKLQSYIDKGGDINKNITWKTEDGETVLYHPFIYALGSATNNSFKVLFENRSKLENKDALISEAFVLSLSSDNEEFAQMLYAEKPNVNANCEICHDHNAIMVAIVYGKEDWYFKLKKDSDFKFTSEDGNSLLHLAAISPSMKIAKDILAMDNLDINAINKLGQTPLDFAAWNKANFDIFNLFVTKGADLNSADNILARAAESQNYYVFTDEIMLTRQGDLWKSDKTDFIPLNYATYPYEGEFDKHQFFITEQLLIAMIKELKSNSAENYSADYFLNTYVVQHVILLTATLMTEEEHNPYKRLLQMVTVIIQNGKESPLTKNDYKYACKIFGTEKINAWYAEYGLPTN